MFDQILPSNLNDEDEDYELDKIEDNIEQISLNFKEFKLNDQNFQINQDDQEPQNISDMTTLEKKSIFVIDSEEKYQIKNGKNKINEYY